MHQARAYLEYMHWQASKEVQDKYINANTINITSSKTGLQRFMEKYHAFKKREKQKDNIKEYK